MAQYSRVFVTLIQDRAGYGQRSREPSGRAIIEVKDGRGKVMLTVQELKGEIVYKTYIVSSTHGSIAVKMGSLCADERGKAELKWDFDPIDVEQTGITIDEFDAVTVIVQSKTENAWVLTGYRNGEVRFKDKFNEAVKREKAIIENQAVPEPEPMETPLDNETLFKPMEMFAEDEFAEKEYEKDELEEMSESEIVSESEIASESEIIPKPEIVSELEIAPELEIVHETEEIPAVKPESQEPPLDEQIKFQSVAQKFDKELETLESLMHEEKENESKLELDKIMNSNAAMSPFKTGFEEVKWVKIALRELTHLPSNCWKMMYDPYVNLMFNRYKHIMLGAYVDRPRFILALPDELDPWRERHAKRLGFNIFRTSDNIVGEHNINYGYWLMEFES